MAQRVRKPSKAPDERPPEQQEAPKKRTSGKRRQRRKTVIRLLIVGLIMLAVYVVASNWQDLFPGTFVAWVYDLRDGTTGGDWPASLSGDTAFDMADADGNLVLVTDTDTVYYNRSGGASAGRPCSYAKPLLRVTDRHVAVFETGGNRYRLEGRAGIELEKTVDNKIYTGAVSADGDVAVVTDSMRSYISEVTVFSDDGEKRYQWLSSEWLVMDVAFSHDGNSLAAVGCRTQNGAMQSTILVFDLRGKDEQPTQYIGEQVLYSRVHVAKNGKVIAIGDSHARFVNPTGSLDQLVAYDGVELIGCAFGKNDVMIVTRPYGAQDGGTAGVYSSDGELSYAQEMQGAFRDCCADGNDFLALTDRFVYHVNDSRLIKSGEVSADSLMVGTVGNRIVVLGLTQLTIPAWSE